MNSNEKQSQYKNFEVQLVKISRCFPHFLDHGSHTKQMVGASEKQWQDDTVMVDRRRAVEKATLVSWNCIELVQGR